MSYEPQFTITPRLLSLVEGIAALRERILGAAVEVSWIPALQKDTRTRNGHASTAIEGNPLTLEQVRALEEGRELVASDARSSREVLNYFAGLRYVEKHAKKKTLRHEDLFELHRILADRVMDQGTAGSYRTIQVRVCKHLPPAAADVSGLMFELLEWWNKRSTGLSPVLSSAILHYQFEHIHPFADGNGRTGRALALWELYRRGFDRHHIFSVDEFYWEDRPGYYAALDAVLAVVPHPSRGGVLERRRGRGRRAHEKPYVVRLALSPPGGAHRRGVVFIPSRIELRHRGGAVGTHRPFHGCVVPVILRG